MKLPRLIRELADTLRAGVWKEAAILRRLRKQFGEQPWLGGLAERAASAFPSTEPPDVPLLAKWLSRDRQVVRLQLTPAPFAKAPGPPSTWDTPPLTTEDDLCKWLDVSHEHLAWLANAHSPESERRQETLRNYFYKWIPKRSGGWRLLEVPKAKLKAVQRRVLEGILDKIPPHPNAHGFRKGGSVKRFVSPHTGQPLVLRMDLKDFFISIQVSRVRAIFQTAGYSERIARMLAGLCTNTVPSSKMRPPDPSVRLLSSERMQLRTPHLPQGAPTSPALANLCAYRFDVRFTALAKKYGFVYSRYADDLLFSGPARGKNFLRQFQIWVGAIATEENFKVNMRKTRAMRQSVRQHAAGLVLNEKPSISRDQFDALKATLHNCLKHGPSCQNHDNHAQYRAHLLGRINYVAGLNPERGGRLRKIFERIAW